MIKVVLEKDLRNQFKGQCALNGTNMNAVLSEFIEIYVQNSGKITINPQNPLTEK